MHIHCFTGASSGVEAYPQVLGRAQNVAQQLRRRFLRIEAKPGQLVEQGVQCAGHFDFRQMLTDAQVRAAGEGDMAVLAFAKDIEAVRVFELAWIAVGRAQRQIDGGALRDAHSVDFGIDLGVTMGAGDRPFQRSASSIACEIRLRSARTASSWSVWVRRPVSKALVPRNVVSPPAFINCRRNEIRMLSGSISPSTSMVAEVADQIRPGICTPLAQQFCKEHAEFLGRFDTLRRADAREHLRNCELVEHWPLIGFQLDLLQSPETGSGGELLNKYRPCRCG